MFGITNLSDQSITTAQMVSMRQTLSASKVKQTIILHNQNVALIGPSSSQSATSLNMRQLEPLRISAKSHLVHKTALIDRLELKKSSIIELDDNVLILLAYQRWGESCINYLHGEFVFSIWDSQRQRLFCARDRMGVYPFFYYWHNNSFVFADAMFKIVQLPDVRLTSNPTWVADHLCLLWLDKEQTFYNEINRLPPAHALTISSQGLWKTRYWEFDPHAELSLESNEAYCESARNKLFFAVNRCMESVDSIGVELSGGLDSTTIAAIAQHERKHRSALQLSVFSHASPPGMTDQQGFRKDERQNINMVCEYAGITTKHFFTNSGNGVISLLENAIKLGGGTDRCDFATLTSGIHALAATQGVQVMLSGLGGDHLVSSPIQTHNYLLRNRLWKLLWRELSLGNTNSFHKTIWNLLKLGVTEYVPSHKRAKLQTQKKRWQQKKVFVESMLQNVPELQSYISGIDWKQRIDDAWDTKACSLPKTIREAQIKLVTNPELTNRLEATAQIAASVGIEYRYPLLDIDLMTFFLSLPPDQKRRQGYGRYLFRCCSQGLLPEEIRWSKKFRGAQYPWYLHSVQKDIDCDLPPVAEDAQEETKVGRLIAQARRTIQRNNLN